MVIFLNSYFSEHLFFITVTSWIFQKNYFFEKLFFRTTYPTYFFLTFISLLFLLRCSKFRGSCIIAGLVGLVPPYHCAFVCLKIFLVSILYVKKFHGSQIFSREDFVCPKFFLVVISLVQDFFTWIFRGSKIVGFCGFFLWVQNCMIFNKLQ